MDKNLSAGEVTEDVLYWQGDPIDDDIHCPVCSTIGPNLPRFYVKYCNYCGTRLHFKEGEEEE